MYTKLRIIIATLVFTSYTVFGSNDLTYSVNSNLVIVDGDVDSITIKNGGASVKKGVKFVEVPVEITIYKSGQLESFHYKSQDVFEVFPKLYRYISGGSPFFSTRKNRIFGSIIGYLAETKHIKLVILKSKLSNHDLLERYDILQPQGLYIAINEALVSVDALTESFFQKSIPEIRGIQGWFRSEFTMGYEEFTKTVRSRVDSSLDNSNCMHLFIYNH